MDRRGFFGAMAAGLAWAASKPAVGLELPEGALSGSSTSKPGLRFLYAQGPLVMTEDFLLDAIGAFSLAQFSALELRCEVQRKRGIQTCGLSEGFLYEKK